MAGAHLLFSSAEKALDVLRLFSAMISLSAMKGHLPHPSVACGISEFGNARGKQPVKEFEILPSWSWPLSLVQPD